MTAHRPGTSLPNQLRDRSAMARAGVSVPNDTDQPPTYGSEETCWPEESRLTFGGKRRVGTCPDDGFATVIDGNGCGGVSCVFCGRQLEVRS